MASQPPPPQTASQPLDEEQGNVSPEEQAQYDQFMENALTLIYVQGQDGGEVRPEILQALQVQPEEGAPQEGTPNPAVLALAQTTVTIVSQLDDSAREAGQPVTDDVLYHGGLAVTEELAEVADAAKLYDYTEEDIAGAFAQAVDMYREKAIADGRTDKQTLEGQFNEVNQAEAAGQLDSVLPGLGGAPQKENANGA